MKSSFDASSAIAADECGLHPLVQRDVSRVLRHYDDINDHLGDEFWEDLTSIINQAAAAPQRFHFETRNLRRANLKRFPYHFLFREIAGGIRITAVRHHNQHPERSLK